MTDRTRHEIDLIDSANKHRKYKLESIKKFCDWLDTCPCDYTSIDDNLNIIEFKPLKRKWLKY